MADTESFTFRMPLDIKQEIEKRTGKRKRSELVIQLLREALGLAEVQQNSTVQISLESRIVELAHIIEIMKTEQDKVLHRLSILEAANSSEDSAATPSIQTAIQSHTESKTEEDKQEETNSERQSKTEEDKQEEANPERQSKTIRKTASDSETIPLDIDVETIIPEHAIKVATKELLRILNTENFDEKWTPQRLQKIREGSQSRSWQTVGKYRFIYANEPFTSRKQGHLWWVESSDF